MICYEIDTGVAFKLRHYWDILKDRPKWQEIALPKFSTGSRGSKRHKSSGYSSFNTESREQSINLNTIVGDIDEDDVQEIRPEGRYKARAAARKKKGSKSGSTSNVNEDALAKLMVTEMTAQERKERLAFLDIKRMNKYRVDGGRISRNLLDRVCPHTLKVITRVLIQEERNPFPKNVTMKEHVHGEQKCSLKVKIAEGDTRSQNRKRKSQALKRTTYHNHGREDFKNQQRRDNFTLLTKSPKEILALDKGKFKTPPPMTTRVEKRNNNKFCEFHEEVRHNTDECMHLKRQIEELIKARKLSHVIKERTQGSGKDQPKAAKKGEASKKAMEILMVLPWQRMARQCITQSFSPNSEISFPTLEEEDGVEGSMVIETEIGGHVIHRIYIDEGGEIIWPMGQILLPVKKGDAEHLTSTWMNFFVVRSPSPYNGIIGRPGVKKIQAVPSTAYGMLKFPVQGGILTLRISRIIPLNQGGRVVYLLLYVYDIILTTSTTTLLQHLIDSWHHEFGMTNLGALNYFVGIFVVCHSTDLFLSQRNLAGGLQYLTFTRPDLSYAVQQIFLYVHDPREPDFAALKRILRYHTLSRSSAEAEYKGVANVVADTAWLCNLLRELHSPLSTTTLVYCDNIITTFMYANHVQHQWTKHIEIDIHFVRDMVTLHLDDKTKMWDVGGDEFGTIEDTGFLEFVELSLDEPELETVFFSENND
uniref:Reverse transcriptase domain-containing protein n=1 Tax=Tanacetum cinerariifolium TaxID=118510 RepID=A0A6L2LE69_TANCI|nr:reverse transcriptase domain-containing protein [Tanacetum cinerariifolium]